MLRETDKAIVAHAPTGGIVEHSYWLRGMQDSYMDMAADLGMVELVADRVVEWLEAFWTAYMEEIGDLVQVVQMGDDLGGQDGPLFSPEVYRKIFKPRETRLIDIVRKHSKAKIYFHCCGAIREYIPDLIEIGVDALNPVQIQARNMDSAGLKKDFGKDLCFWGGGANPERRHVAGHAGGRAARGEKTHRGPRPGRRVRVRLRSQHPVRGAARRTSSRFSMRRGNTADTEREDGSMERLALCYRAIPEKKQEYIRAHREIWPEITRGLKEAGCHEMTIFMRGDSLFIYAAHRRHRGVQPDPRPRSLLSQVGRLDEHAARLALRRGGEGRRSPPWRRSGGSRKKTSREPWRCSVKREQLPWEVEISAKRRNGMKKLGIALLVCCRHAAAAHDGRGGETRAGRSPSVSRWTISTTRSGSGIKKGIDDAGKDLGVDLVIRTAEGDAVKQNNQIDDMIAQGVSGIVCVYVDFKSILQAVKACNKAGVPFVYCDRTLDSTADAKVAWGIATDNYALTVNGWKWMADYARKNKMNLKVLELVGSLSDENVLKRTDGLQGGHEGQQRHHQARAAGSHGMEP